MGHAIAMQYNFAFKSPYWLYQITFYIRIFTVLLPKMVNELSIAKALLNLIKQNYNCEDVEPTEREKCVATLLMEKIETVEHEYVFIEAAEEDHFGGTCIAFSLHC